jgi:dTMP kinase
MSTAGKVLTVLNLLVMVAWIVMLSAVTQLNVNWQQRIQKQEADLAKAEQAIADSNARYLDLTEQARAEQANKDLDLRETQGRIIAAEGRRSAKTEELTRAQIQLADYEAAVKRAEANRATRLAEGAKAEQDLAALRAEIARKQDENAKLRDQLARLQDDFKRLLSNNAKQVGGATGDRPESKPASDRRTPPAS